MIQHRISNQLETLSIAGGTYHVLVSGKDTNKSFAIIEMNIPPGKGPLPHAHKDIDETFYVAEGSVDFISENGSFTANKGELVHIPKGGVIHHFKNRTTGYAKLICTVSPAGMDEMFEKVNAEGPQKALEIGEQYGNVFFPMDYFEEK